MRRILRAFERQGFSTLVDLKDGQDLRFAKACRTCPVAIFAAAASAGVSSFPAGGPVRRQISRPHAIRKIRSRQEAEPAAGQSQQFSLPQRQHLRSQLFGDPADGLLVQVDSLTGQFLRPPRSTGLRATMEATRRSRCWSPAGLRHVYTQIDYAAAADQWATIRRLRRPFPTDGIGRSPGRRTR